MVDLPDPDGPGDDDRLPPIDREVDAVEDDVVVEALADPAQIHQMRIATGG
jgi:hypothetical protein